MTEPTRVLIAGDWHGNLEWARAVLGQLPALMPEGPPWTILHVGDFGVWPGRVGDRYLAELGDCLRGMNARLLFVDGNHEDFEQLEWHRLNNHGLHMTPTPIGRGEIVWLPRGTRWKWHDRWWVAAGGAVSIDRAFRRAGRDWWPEEEISEADHERIAAPGRAEVMVCHDAPTSVPMSFGQWPSGWDIADRARADAHRDRLQAIVDEVQPSLLLHGHYHRYHDVTVPMSHGGVRVIGLDRDDSLAGNYRVLNVATMNLEAVR